MPNTIKVSYEQTELVTNWMYERIKNVSVIAENPFITKCAQIAKEDVDYPDIVHYLEVVKNKYGYTGILVSNDKGLVTAATAEEDAGSDISHMDYFKRAVQGHTFVSGIIPSEIPLTNEFGEKELGMPTMFVSTPLRNKYGIVVGIVAIRMDVKALNDLLLSLKLGKTEETYLVSKDGYMLTESRFAQDLKDMFLRSFLILG